MSSFVVVLVTCGSEEEAEKIGRALVEEGLAACVNLLSPIRSIYRWEGRTCDKREWLLLIKTQTKRFAALEERVRSLHSYSVPEIISLSVLEGAAAYLDWVKAMTER